MPFSAVEPKPLSCMPRQMKTPISNILMWRLSTLSSIKRARCLWVGPRSWPKILTCSKTTKVSLNVSSFLQSISTYQSFNENQQQAPIWSLSNLHGESDTDMWTHWDRMMTATWVTDEVKKAVEKGNILDKIFEVWHFERISLYDPQTKSGGAFTDYVNTFLKKAKLPVGQNGVKPIMTDINTQRNTTKGKEFVSNTITLHRTQVSERWQNWCWTVFGGIFGQRENMPKNVHTRSLRICRYADK